MKTAAVWVDGRFEIIWAFDYKDALWLCAEWLPAQREGWLRPARIISLAGLAHHMTPESGPADILVMNPIPKTVLFGPDQRVEEFQYIVAENPDIEFPRQEIYG